MGPKRCTAVLKSVRLLYTSAPNEKARLEFRLSNRKKKNKKKKKKKLLALLVSDYVEQHSIVRIAAEISRKKLRKIAGYPPG